jgi:hypothetical protein
MAEDMTAVEALREYAEHQSWRCAYPPHYYFADPEVARLVVLDGDCPCGLLKVLRSFGIEGEGGDQ